MKGAVWMRGALLCAALVLAACEQGPPRRDILGTEKKLYSQFDEELIIRDFFQDRRGGFFLDVGAAWPLRNNNTYYLEKHLAVRERLLAYFGTHGYERLEMYLAHDPTNWYFAPKAAADAR